MVATTPPAATRPNRPALVTAESDPDADLPLETLGPLLAEGYRPADVDALRAANAGLPYFELLRDLVRLGEADFAVRLAVLSELAGSERTRWDYEALGRQFAWLNADARSAVLRSLRRGGWLELVEGQLRLSERGEALYAILSRVIGIEPQEGDLALGVLNVELSRDLGHEQAPALRHLHHNLRRIVDAAEGAVRSHSEVRVLQAQERVERNLAWARRARAALETLKLDDDACYRVAQQVGQSLSELHQWQAVLQRATGDLQAKRIQLGRTGLSLTDVTAFLMRCDVEVLAEFGRPLVSIPVAPLFLIADNALSEAEYEWLQVPARPDQPYAVAWTEGPPQTSVPGDPELPEFTALDAFVADVRALAGKGGAQKLSAFVPRRSWAESAYRLSLLALGESMGEVHAAEGAGSALLDMQALRATPFAVAVVGDGSEKDRVFTDAASEVSRGVVRLQPVAADGPALP
ncbi:MAG: hypothetical protein FJ100_03955 [Deltaproteobacteria bacterium]|nr:hypothetical protein [Deltaproteobacteria bacterium]